MPSVFPREAHAVAITQGIADVVVGDGRVVVGGQLIPPHHVRVAVIDGV